MEHILCTIVKTVDVMVIIGTKVEARDNKDGTELRSIITRLHGEVARY